MEFFYNVMVIAFYVSIVGLSVFMYEHLSID